MPNYVAGSAPTLWPGDLGLSFNVESPAPPQAGTAFRLGGPAPAIGGLIGISAQAKWSAAPSAAVVSLELANDDTDTSYVEVDRMTFTGTQQTMRLDPAGITARFARLKLVSHTGAETLVGGISR